MNRTLAITGGTGFVGSHVLERATARSRPVRSLARKLPKLASVPSEPNLSWIEGSLANPASLTELCSGARTIIHIAGAVSAPNLAAFVEANVRGTERLIAAAQATGVSRFIHVSSLAAAQPSLSDYGWSKYAAEKVVQKSGLNWIIVRPPGVYGPRDSDVLEMFRMATKGFMLLPPPGRASWIHASDLARLLLALVDGGPTGTILEPDDGQPMSHIATAQLIGAAVGRPRLHTLSAPRWLLNLAGRGDRLVRGDKAKLTPDRARYMAHPDWTSDPAKRPDPALWTPHIAPEQGFADTANWYRAQGWL